ALIRREPIADDRVSSRRTGRFTHPDTKPRNEKRPIIPRQTRSHRKQAPNRDSDAEDAGAFPMIRQTSKWHAHNRIKQSKCGAQPTHFQITEAPSFSDRLHYRTQYLPVVKIHRIDAE